MNFMKSLTLAIFALAVAHTAHASPAFLEKLGFQSDDKLLIIHADDLGLCHAVNEASFTAMKKGAVSSSSVLMQSPWVSEVLQFKKDNPTADLGIHLNFTSEWKTFRWRPLAALASVQSLIDPFNFLRSSPEEVLKNAIASEFELEIQAQIEQALKMGLQPSHLDTHSAVVFTRSDLAEAYVKMAKRYRILPLLPRVTPENEAFMKAMGLPFEELKAKLIQYENEEMSFVTQVHMDAQTKGPKLRAQAYRELFGSLKPGVSLILTDLGNAGPELKAITSSVAEGNESMKEMFSDVKFFADPNLKAQLKKMKIHLISWQDIANHFKF